jgi:2-polyprenyl-3-methyl-5-hydroxy-6-metoxy-1,4-benzoquinol methylase
MSVSVELGTYREQAAEASGGTSSDAIYDAIEQTVRDLFLEGDILDYGAGKGILARRLLDANHFKSVWAVDIMPKPHDLTPEIRWLQQDLNEKLPDCHFDAVIAAEVIEHLENPRFMLRELFRILKPGGTAIISTPNNESWRALLALVVRGHYVCFDDSCYPAHITALLRKDLTRAFFEAGFAKPYFRFTNRGALPKVTALSWQQISFGILKGLRYSDNVLAIGQKPHIFA